MVLKRKQNDFQPLLQRRRGGPTGRQVSTAVKNKRKMHILFSKHPRYLPAPQHISLRIICKSALTELDSMIYFLKLIKAW